MTGVSFIVTVYNKAVFLPAVLGAIFAQEGDFAREFIIIDDGSRDDSVAVMERLCSGRTDVRIIRQANAGPAKATNAAVKAATLPWLKIVDGDDVLAPWCTQSLLEATSRLGTRFAVGRTVIYRDLAHVAFPEASAPPAIRRGDLFAECLRNAPCNLTPTLIDRALYWEVGGCDERLFIQDFSLLLRLSWRETPVLVDRAVNATSDLPGSRVTDNQRLILKETNQAMIYFLAETAGLPFAVRRTAVERAFGRAWKWQRRKLGASLASRWFWLYALAKLGPPGLASPFLASTLDAFAAPAGGRP
ncbi:MAG: glycosyltransferase family 2 protein [Alphaproteobacteria bacterium]|nr:glycosyltransferase family 2 protein [Alphaproteobacteria bacterium]